VAFTALNIGASSEVERTGNVHRQIPTASGLSQFVHIAGGSSDTDRRQREARRIGDPIMVRINRFDIENVKRVQAVQLEPSPNGLTIIGGRNAQGKTSVLDAIVWALGGNKHRPSKPKRDDSFAEPTIVVELDNGIVVRREGKNASLKVLDERGNKAGQALLDELISQLALDLPRFLNSSGREKAEILLQVIGVGEQLMELDHKAESLYNERHALGQIATRKRNTPKIYRSSRMLRKRKFRPVT
jgi:hypothetical protein